MCESEYGAGRPLELQSFTDIVSLYDSCIAFIKRSPIVAITSVSTRTNDGASYPSSWQALTTNDYSVDTEINQINISSALNNWGLLGRRRSLSSEAKIVYTSGFDFSTDTSQEANAIRSICGRIVSYMATAVAIGKASITDTDGFQSFVSTDNYLSAFLFPLGKYRPHG